MRCAAEAVSNGGPLGTIGRGQDDDQVDVQRIERGLEPHARRGHRSFTSGMTGAHDSDVELFSKPHLNRKQSNPRNLLHFLLLSF